MAHTSPMNRADKWKACKHIIDETAKSAVLVMPLPGAIIACRPCIVSGSNEGELIPLNKTQLINKLFNAGINEILDIKDFCSHPNKIRKAEIHPCNACDKNRTNLILMSIEAEFICKDLMDCPFVLSE